MALPKGDQQKRYSPNCQPALMPPEASASSRWTARGICISIPAPPATGTVQKAGLGDEDPTQTVILFPSGCHAAEVAQNLFCAIHSASTSRGELPSSRTT